MSSRAATTASPSDPNAVAALAAILDATRRAVAARVNESRIKRRSCLGHDEDDAGQSDGFASENDGVVLVDVGGDHATIRSYVGRRFQLLSATTAWVRAASVVQVAVVVRLQVVVVRAQVLQSPKALASRST